MSKRWTCLILAMLISAAVSVEPLALTSLQEQQSQQTVSTEAAQKAESQPSEEQGMESAESSKTESSESVQSQQETASQPQTALQSPSAGTESELLNDVELSPQSPSSAALDTLVTSVMDGVLDDGMTTYEKVKACYDYVTSNTGYGDHMAYMSTPIGSGTCWDVYLNYGEVEGFGAVALTAKTGMCNAYASAFILMARRLGLDAQLVKGYTLSGGGNYAYHEWAEVTIDGVPYVFDPQLEQNLAKWGLPAYYVFCKPYSALGKRYSK